MTRLLAISPHLDDAVFSVGATLARAAAGGNKVVVATCFTGNIANSSGFALACQLDKGLGPEVDYMALRRAEDIEACAAIGAEPVHLPFLEAPHRGYDSPAALFGPLHPEPDLDANLAAALSALIAAHRPDLILAPAAIGDHVDHRLVRRTVERVATVPVRLWADLPYAARSGQAPVAFAPTDCGDEMVAKAEAAGCYRSQLAFQFAGQVLEPLLSIDAAEWFSVPEPRKPRE